MNNSLLFEYAAYIGITKGAILGVIEREGDKRFHNYSPSIMMWSDAWLIFSSDPLYYNIQVRFRPEYVSFMSSRL